MAITNAINSTVVKTELDDVFNQVFNLVERHPGIATHLTPQIFKQKTMDNAAHIEAVLSGGGGYWLEKGEEQDVPLASPRVTNKVSYFAVTFAHGLQLSKEFFDDNMHGTWTKMVEDFAREAKFTQMNTAFGLWRGAFTTTLTADGSAFISSSHTLIDGTTQSNIVSGNPPLSPDALNLAIVQLSEMKSQSNVIMGCMPDCLLVPSKLYKKAVEVTDSKLLADTANNNINVYSAIYGLSVYFSPFLGAAAAGSDTAWFVLSQNHCVTRYVRAEIETVLNDWRLSSNNNYEYKGIFREKYGVTDYIGVVGSKGDAS